MRNVLLAGLDAVVQPEADVIFKMELARCIVWPVQPLAHLLPDLRRGGPESQSQLSHDLQATYRLAPPLKIPPLIPAF